MKITKNVLKQIIKEELEALDENPIARIARLAGGRPANDNVAKSAGAGAKAAGQDFAEGRPSVDDILASILRRLKEVERKLDNLTG